MLGGLLTVFCLGCFAPPQTYDLSWKPKTEETHVYSLNVAFEFSDGSLVSIKGFSRFLVTSVKPNGSYVLESSTFQMTSTANGEAQVVPDQAAAKEEFDRWGAPIGPDSEEDPQDTFSFLMDRLSRFQSPGYPVKVGDTWTGWPIKVKRGIPPRIAYTLSAIEKFQGKQVEKVSYVASDQPGESTATGTILLDFTNHSLVQLIVNIPHFRPDADGPSAVATIKLTEKATG